MVYKAIIFDLDGTLINSLPDIADSVNYSLREFGFPTHDLDTYRLFIGNGLRNLIIRSLPKDRHSNHIVDLCVKTFNKYYDKNWDLNTRPYPGISEMLDELTKRGIRLAVLSNKPYDFTLRCVSRFLSNWNFEVVLGQSEALPKKPDPSGALEIADRMNFLPSQILYLGDSDVDIQTAIASQMFPVGVLWGYRSMDELKKNGARALIDNPLEVLDLLREGKRSLGDSDAG